MPIITDELRRWISRQRPQEDAHARLARGAGWGLGASVLSRGLAFITALTLARALGPNSFGQLALVQSTLAVATTVSALGLPVASSRLLAHYRSLETSKASSIAAFVLRVSLIAGAISLVAVLLLADQLAIVIGAPPGFALLVRLAGGVIFLGACGIVQTAVLYGIEAIRTVFIVNSFRSLVTSLLLIGGGVLYGLAGAAFALSISELLAVMFAQSALARALRRAGVRLRRAGWSDQFTELARMAFPALAAGLSVQAALWFGQLTLASQGFARHSRTRSI